MIRFKGANIVWIDANQHLLMILSDYLHTQALI